MIHERIPMVEKESAEYAALYTYIYDYYESIAIEKRPLIIICPGGAYAYTSDREAESIALQFCAMGYHAAVLRYTTVSPCFPTAIRELAYSVKVLKENAEKWHIDADKILVAGCSAGGHLAASFGCFWKKDFLKDIYSGNDAELIKPAGLILMYPVITSGEFAHVGSIENLTGFSAEGGINSDNSEAIAIANQIISENSNKGIGTKEIDAAEPKTDKEKLYELVSLEKQVSEDTPPCFIWHTYEDGSVPIENSLYFMMALRRANVSAEYHVFPHGGHGLALGNEITAGHEGKEIVEEASMWIPMVRNWLVKNYPITHNYNNL